MEIDFNGLELGKYLTAISRDFYNEEFEMGTMVIIGHKHLEVDITRFEPEVKNGGYAMHTRTRRVRMEFLDD